MKRFLKPVVHIIMTVVVIALILPQAVFATSLEDNEITSQAAIVIEFATGLVIYEFNADEMRVPASMTKMAAVYVVFDAIRDGLISMDTVTEISDGVSISSYNKAFTNVPMPRESSYTIQELLDVVIVRSACAATVALGEAIFGNEQVMVAKMNEKMDQLGIMAVFFDSWGGSPNNKISARGMAEMTRAFINEYPEVLNITSKSTVVFDGISYSSTNPLFGDYEGIDGFKTGFTNPAGWCFSGTARRGTRRIISVTMGSETGHRFPDSVILLDYGFANYNSVIADHFRTAIWQSNRSIDIKSVLVPIMLYNIEEARSLELLDLAIALNET